MLKQTQPLLKHSKDSKMGYEPKRDAKQPTDKDGKIKIDRLFPEKSSEKTVNSNSKLLALPSGRVSGKNKKKRQGTRRRNRMIRRNVTVLFDELTREVEALEGNDTDYPASLTSSEITSDSSSAYSRGIRGGSGLSRTNDPDIDEIYKAIDGVNKLCLDPIKVKLRKEYSRAKKSRDKGDAMEDIRYSADINIVLSSRSDEKLSDLQAPIADEEKESSDFSVLVESVSDSSKSDQRYGQIQCFHSKEFQRQGSKVTKDSVRTLENLISPTSTLEIEVNSSSTSNYTRNDSGPKQDANQVCDTLCVHNYREFTLPHKDEPYYGRTLFYRYHEPDKIHQFKSGSGSNRAFKIEDPNCLTPDQLGFDSLQSLNNSVNAPSEVIIKPPVTIGKSISFRSNVCKSMLSRDNFISDCVFQVNWSNPRGRRKRPSSFTCCA